MRQALLLCVLVVSLGLVSAFLSPHQPRSGHGRVVSQWSTTLSRSQLYMSTEANDGTKRARRRSRKGGKSRAEKLEQGLQNDPLSFGRDWEVDGLIKDEPKGAPLPRLEDFKKVSKEEEGKKGNSEVYLTPLERARLGLDKKPKAEGPTGAPGYFDFMKTVTWWAIGIAVGAEVLVHSPLVKYLPGYVPPPEGALDAASSAGSMMGM